MSKDTYAVHEAVHDGTHGTHDTFETIETDGTYLPLIVRFHLEFPLVDKTGDYFEHHRTWFSQKLKKKYPIIPHAIHAENRFGCDSSSLELYPTSELKPELEYDSDPDPEMMLDVDVYSEPAKEDDEVERYYNQVRPNLIEKHYNECGTDCIFGDCPRCSPDPNLLLKSFVDRHKNECSGHLFDSCVFYEEYKQECERLYYPDESLNISVICP